MKTQKKKSSYSFIKRQKQNLLTVMPNCFPNKKTWILFWKYLTKAKYFHKTYLKRRGSQRQYVESYSKNERKISKAKTKILAHALRISEKQSLHKSNDEEPNQPATERKFEQTWPEERPTKRKRDRDTYLSPPSKKINLKLRWKTKNMQK